MRFNNHSELEGLHAFLSASKHHWLNYSKDKLIEVYKNMQAKEHGTELHEFAATCIKLRQKLPSNKKTLNNFVNDAIGYRMIPEQILYFSEYCFGTADAIIFEEDEKILRIHDLKTGETPASMDQLRIYAALFCLEYRIDPESITIELRIYQNDQIVYEITEHQIVRNIMNIIINDSKILTKMKSKE